MLRGIVSWRTLLLGVAAGFGAMAAVGLASDLDSMLRQMARFPVSTVLPAALGFTLFNYAVRFLRWHWLVGKVSPSQVGWGCSLLTFFSGFSMVLTPGKVGELVKSYLLKAFAGVPAARSAPVVFAERLYDGIAMVLLSLLGLVSFKTAVVPVVAFAAASVVLVWAFSRRELMERAVELAGRVPLLKPRLQSVAGLLASARELTSLKLLVPSVALGVLSWFGECLAFYLVLVGLGLPAGVDLLRLATFVLAVATLVGSLSMLPGGVGAAELTIAGLLVLLASLGKDAAGAATIIIRLCTLWFGALLGAFCLGAAALKLQASRKVESVEAP